MKKECVAMLLAGGQGSRLYVLTGDMAKPAVPFGGKFRIIDFPLSNCTNSGIDTVGVLTQYRPLELNSYIGSGQPWELDRLNGGVHILPPYQSASGASWYKGTANAIYQNIGFVDLYDPEYVAVLSGDHIYKMDYAAMLRFHEQHDSDCTIAVREVPLKEASRFGIMNTRPDGTIYEFEEKPKKVFVVHGEDSACTAFTECLKIEYGQRAYAPYSGTEFDLISNKFTYEAAPVAVKKKTKPVTGVFERLLASARRLLALVTKSEGVMTNKDMAKFADQINSLCDKWEI